MTAMASGSGGIDLEIAPIAGRDDLSLTPLSVDDADSMVEVLADPQLYVFTGGEAPDLEGLTRRYLVQVRGGPADGSARWLNWIVRWRDHGPVGYVQATVYDIGDGMRADLAWVTGTPWQGRGIATAASQLMMDWLAERGVQHFTASIHPRHVSSRKVAFSLGLRRSEELTDEGEEVWTTAVP